jgi:streptomycin 6-kinase
VKALALVLLVACSASQRKDTLTAAEVTVDSAEIAFQKYDAAEQMNIVAAAPDKPTGQAALLAYRAKQTKVLLVFVAAYQSLAAAWKANDDASLATALAAAAALATELKGDGIL